MKNRLLLILIALLLPAPLRALDLSMGMVRGLEKPLKVLESPRPDLANSAAGHVSIQRCYVFPTFVAIEIDTGQVGADEVSIREREAGKGALTNCASPKRAGDVTLKQEEQYVLGVAGDFLFTRSADGAGEEMSLWVYDVASGKQLFEAVYHLHRDFQVTKRAQTLSLEYFAPLSLSCDLTQSHCWQQTLRENHVPSRVKLDRPDCRAVFQSADWKAHPELVHVANAIQLFTKVLVPDVRNATLQFEGGKTLCNAAP